VPKSLLTRGFALPSHVRDQEFESPHLDHDSGNARSRGPFLFFVARLGMKFLILAMLLAGSVAPLPASADVNHPTVSILNATDTYVHVKVQTQRAGKSGPVSSWCLFPGKPRPASTMSDPMSKVIVAIGSKMVCGVGTTLATISTTGEASFNGTVSGTHGQYTFTRQH
jgi:hypothetical protein